MHSVLGKDTITALLKVVVIWSQYQQRIQVQVPNGKLEVQTVYVLVTKQWTK